MRVELSDVLGIIQSWQRRTHDEGERQENGDLTLDTKLRIGLLQCVMFDIEKLAKQEPAPPEE